MSDLSVRKTAYSVEEIFHEGGPKPVQSLRHTSAMVIIEAHLPESMSRTSNGL